MEVPVGQEQHAVVRQEAAAVRQEQPHELVRQLQFPPGYHFVPKEEELVDIYLRAKIEGGEPPLHVVNEVNILDWQPGSLVEAYKGYGEEKWYFFTVRELSTSNKEEPNRKVRAPGVKATWKATGSVVDITAKGRQEGGGEAEEPAAAAEKVVVGTKRVLIYHSSDPEEDGKWSMHEYILAGHGKIGQYVLCSIQRKQHSDTVDNAGEGSSRIISRRKRTNASSVDPGKTKKRRTNKNKAVSTQPEGVQLQQQEVVAPIKAPLKPESRTRRTVPNRENEASAQATEGQQHHEIATVSPAESPLTPPMQAPPQALQQEQKPMLAAYSAPVLHAVPPNQAWQQEQMMALEMYSAPVLHATPPMQDPLALQQEQKSWAAYSAPALPAAPLQGYPSHPDGMLGASAPTHEEEDTGAHQDISRSIENLKILLRSGDQQKKQLQGDADYNSFAVHDQNLYTQEQYFLGSITQNHNSWDHSQHQIQEIGGPFGAPEQHMGDAFGAPGHHTNAQYYDQSSYEQMYEFLLPGCDLSDQFITVASGSDGDMGLAGGDGVDPMSFLCDHDPQDCVGTEDESSRQALQSNPEAVHRNQDEHAANGHACDEQPPS